MVWGGLKTRFAAFRRPRGVFFTSLKLALPVFRLPYSRLERLVGYGYPTYGFRVAFLRFRLPWRPSENSVASVSLPYPAGEGRGGGGVSAETLFFVCGRGGNFCCPTTPTLALPRERERGFGCCQLFGFRRPFYFQAAFNTTYALSSAGRVRCSGRTRRGSVW